MSNKFGAHVPSKPRPLRPKVFRGKFFRPGNLPTKIPNFYLTEITCYTVSSNVGQWEIVCKHDKQISLKLCHMIVSYLLCMYILILTHRLGFAPLGFPKLRFFPPTILF